MTITEAILAKAAGLKRVKPGDIVNARIDVAMAHDGLGPFFFPAFRELGFPIWDKDKVVIVIDHCAPPSALAHTELVADTLQFVAEYDLPHFYNMQGVCHQLVPEQGFIKPGAVAVGTDSHTCTYGGLGAFSTGIGSTEMAWVFATGELWFRVPESIRVEVSGKLGARVMAKDIILKLLSLLGTNGATYKALEFCGETIRELSIDGRLAICNMAIEAGAKNGIVAPDEKTRAYLQDRAAGECEVFASAPDAVYCQTVAIDAGRLEPQLACPHSPANVVPVAKLAGKKVQQVLIGTCTGGRMEDFRVAAEIIRGHKLPRLLRCLILPSSQQIYLDLMAEGLMKVFAEAGCILCNPNCGPCGGMHEGLIAKGEVCVGTHNRNFRGRMGSPDGEVYLASPATAAATAITGVITDPREL